MTEKQKMMIKGMDMMMKKINVHPNDKEFTVEDIVKISNETYEEILNLNI